MAREGVIDDLFIRDGDDNVLRRSNDICLRIESDTTVEVATKRVFVVRHIYTLDDLRHLAKYFGLVWQLYTARSGRVINFNRVNRKSSYTDLGVRISISINCGCKWSICLLGIVKCNYTTSDSVVITRVIPRHSDSCNPTNVDQFNLCRSQSGAYTRCGDEVLKEIMMQVAINPYVSVRSMTTLLQKVLPDRKGVDRHMINNFRIRARRRKFELDSKRIRIYPKHLDSSFIKSYVSTADKYTEDKGLFHLESLIDCCLNLKVDVYV